MVAYILPGDESNLLVALLINLSATAITTGFAIAYIDYLIKVETESSLAAGHKLAEKDLGNILSKLRASLASLYSFELPKLDFKNSKKEFDEFLETLKTSRDTHLRQMADKGDTKKMSKKDIAPALESLQKTTEDLDQLILRFGFALSNDERTEILTLRNDLDGLRYILNIINEIKIEFKDTPYIKDAVVEIDQQIRKNWINLI